MKTAIYGGSRNFNSDVGAYTAERQEIGLKTKDMSSLAGTRIIRCLRFECVWHGTGTTIDAPMCDYAYIHSAYRIPDEPLLRLCSVENCDKYRATKTFRAIAPGTNVFRPVRHQVPSAEKIHILKKQLRKLKIPYVE